MSLANKIWRTRKARINASERLKKNDLYSQILLSYYTLIIIALSILAPTKDQDLILIFSIAIFATSIFIFAMNFKERALMLQTCYIKLDTLSRKASRYEEALKKKTDVTRNQAALDALEEEYNHLLAMSENHSSYDDLKVRFDIRKQQGYNNPPFTCQNWLSLIFNELYRFVMKVFLFIFPLFLVYIFIMKSN